jgi:DNA polymerase/3'-5' exonuclease PolX
MSKNKEIAEIFSKMTDIMELLGENPYRINAYRIPGIGESSVSKILEYLRTWYACYLARYRGEKTTEHSERA